MSTVSTWSSVRWATRSSTTTIRSRDLRRTAPILAEADIVFANCEGIYVRDPSPMLLASDAKNARGLTVGNVGVMSLANNHVMDAGPTGLLQTIEILGELGISHRGCGASTSTRRGDLRCSSATACAWPSWRRRRPSPPASRRSGPGPGINPLRFHNHYYLAEGDLEFNPGVMPEVMVIPWPQDIEAMRERSARRGRSPTWSCSPCTGVSPCGRSYSVTPFYASGGRLAPDSPPTIFSRGQRRPLFRGAASKIMLPYLKPYQLGSIYAKHSRTIAAAGLRIGLDHLSREPCQDPQRWRDRHCRRIQPWRIQESLPRSSIGTDLSSEASASRALRRSSIERNWTA